MRWKKLKKLANRNKCTNNLLNIVTVVAIYYIKTSVNIPYFLPLESPLTRCLYEIF